MAKEYTLESFKEKLYKKHPNSDLKILELYKYGKLLVENKFGKCIDYKMGVLRYGKVSIETAINKTEYFINQAKTIHGNKFDYSQVNYIGCDTKVKIICPIHGEFEQAPYKHLTHKGCTQCSRIQKGKEQTCTNDEFIKKANIKHNNKFDYSLANYVNAKEKIKIICKEHGEFLQNANNHLNGQGCPICKPIAVGNAKRANQENIIKRFIDIHGNKYDYSLVEYTHFEKNVKIICHEHEIFEQTPSVHLRGSGCRKCSNDKMSELQGKLNNGWNYTLWENKGKESKQFDSFKVYIIKCYNEYETFYKIGKTFNTVQHRFQSKRHLPYTYDIIKIIENTARIVSDLEKSLHKIHKEYYYTPQIYFEGNKECFSKLNIELIEEELTLIEKTIKQL